MPPRQPQSQIPTAELLRALRENGVRELRCGDLSLTFWPLAVQSEAADHSAMVRQSAAQPVRVVHVDMANDSAPPDALEYAVNGRHAAVAPFEMAEEATQ